MGSFLTNLWWGGDPDIPDPFSGVSKRDIFTVQSTWAAVNAQSGVYGMELFLRLFRKDPNTQKFFRNLEGMSEERIKKSVVFKAHIQNLMSSFNTAVVNLDQPEVVAALMNKLGTSHHQRHIQIEHFEEFKEVLFDFFVKDLKLSETAVDSWRRFIDFTFRHIYELLKTKFYNYFLFFFLLCTGCKKLVFSLKFCFNLLQKGGSCLVDNIYIII